ncbi:hypothetical protein [Streptomyces anulatus]|uniref:hypothetical protein n=1 Tax=Streptomyces anulatus TaxID=1892 RepID=UPI003F49D4B7
MTPPFATVPTGTRSRPRFEGQYTDATATFERLLHTGDLLPGRDLAPADLAHLTGYTSTAMQYALRQPAIKGAVEAADDRSAQNSARRARKVLQAMIHQHAFPPGSALPSAGDLSFTLLTARRALVTAVDDLVRHRALDHTGTRYAVPAEQPHPGPAPRPEPAASFTRGRPRLPEVSDAPDRLAVRHLRDTARAQWETAERLSLIDLVQRETLQRDLLRRLTLATGRLDGQQAFSLGPVRAALARARAATGSQMVTLGDRRWRYAVLATLLADLADELTRSTSPERITPC